MGALAVADGRFGVGGRGARGGPAGRARSLDGGAPTVAFGVEFEDGAVVDKAVHGGEGHGGVGEDPVPFAEGVVGGDKQRAELVAGADEFEEDAGLGLVLGDVGQVVEDEEVVRVELFDGGLEGELAAGDLELLDEVGGAGEEDAEAALDKGQANAGGEVALAGARWADEYDVVPAGDPGVALGEGVDAGLESMGTAEKSKLARVFPGGRRVSERCRRMRRTPRSATSCSASAASSRADGQPSRSACSVKRG